MMTGLVPAAKIALFRSLFHGRDDVYPRRFESRKTGRSGYAPVCASEWAPGLCEKPRIKCAECPNRRLLPVTDDVIRWHLSGHDDHGRSFIMGVYPMLLDETCLFLAADFDKANWQEDAKAWNRDSDCLRSNNRWTSRPPLRIIRSVVFLLTVHGPPHAAEAGAKLTAGPETRYYVAQYLQKDAVVGEISDVLVVTVPGKA